MKNRCLYLLIIIFCLTNEANAQSTVPDLGESYDANISYTDIISSLLNGDFAEAINLTSSRARQYLSNSNNVQTLEAKLLRDKLLPALQKIFNDASKTQSQQQTAVNQLIDTTILPYQSSNNGTLNLSYTYSADTGFARLSYDVQPRVDRCYYEARSSFTAAPTINSIALTPTSGNYFEVYRISYPVIHVQRVVNGQIFEITQVKGAFVFAKSGVNIDFKNPWNDIIPIFNALRTPGPSGPVKHAVLDVLTSMFLKPGNIVSYRLVAEDAGNSGGYGTSPCTNSTLAESTVFIDSDGDGIPDIIPRPVYLSIVNNSVTAVGVAINMLLQD